MATDCDSSVLLRIVLGQEDALEGWPELQPCVSSELAETECFRVLDRVRLEHRVDDDAMSMILSSTLRLLRGVEIVELSRRILREASRPLPVVLGTLDAIHLFTALAWREERGEDLVVATHDDRLARAARAHGFDVLGVRAPGGRR